MPNAGAIPDPDASAQPKTYLIQERSAETVAGTGSRLWLLADASDCCGALGVNRLRLGAGAAGAKPHFHARSSEAFYVLEGVLRMVVDGEPVSVDRGGLVVIPPGVVHSFGAGPDAVADVLVTLTPGVDRFDYFRLLPKILRGEADPRALAEAPQRYDVHFVDA
ncbi:cupin domain-containing protein [Lysobacter sp. cf310]|uniref:cupin domain-containing protein n=1 Tax=Lysobacter sp. cf310 TaxID=1761790 RepID=UPI0008ECDEF4|nr:cupin domain-containing protein [Lysobacter sp. cf310]SFL25901.1 Cupin domain-containing protein [Lysobacter sp. cf310]